MKPELEDLLKTYDVFKQASESPSRRDDGHLAAVSRTPLDLGQGLAVPPDSRAGQGLSGKEPTPVLGGRFTFYKFPGGIWPLTSHWKMESIDPGAT